MHQDNNIMNNNNHRFLADTGLEYAIDLLRQTPQALENLPDGLPQFGIGERQTLDLLAPHVLGRAARLDNPLAFAHMDPPTPWITWATTLWNARLNQNLLHPATSPFARDAEKKLLDWLTPFFAMQGGHMCSGSTLANLTALWAARDAHGIKKIVASSAAHISIGKAARLLGVAYEQITTNTAGQIDAAQIGDLSNACLVLTAGTTATGAIDSLALAGRAKYTHVDAAWGGPLRLSPTHAHLLKGIDNADSVAVSAHKWLFQPKDSALVMFRDLERANAAISFGGAYLASPNIGVQGSRGASAIPLLATLLAWGSEGIAECIDHSMAMAHTLAVELSRQKNICLWAMPDTGVTLFRPLNMSSDNFFKHLPTGMFSSCVLDGQTWVRAVAANPLADIDNINAAVRAAVQ